LTARRVIAGPLVLGNLRALDAADRELARRAIAWLQRHPEPDGVAKKFAPPPYRPGAIWAFYGPLVLQYRLTPDEIVISRIERPVL
jgi:hypothetical protein